MDDEEEEERILRHPGTAILFSTNRTSSCPLLFRFSCFLLLLLLLVLMFAGHVECRDLLATSPTNGPPNSTDVRDYTTQDWRRSTRGLNAESRCPHEAGGSVGSIVDIDLSVDHSIFTTNILVPTIVYQVSVFPGRKVSDYSLWVDGRCILGSLDPVPSLYNYTAPANRSQVTFKLRYRLIDDPVPYQLSATRQISQDCEIWLKPLVRGNLSSSDLTGPCLLHLQDKSGPSSSSSAALPRALLVTLLKLNVPCTKGALLLSPTRLCGKLEEKSVQERKLYFSDGLSEILIEGTPVFHIAWQHVNPCYNVTMTEKNGSLEIAPTGEISCTYSLLLPYGYRASLSLRLPSGLGESRQALTAVSPEEVDFEACNGVAFELRDGTSLWFHCASSSVLAGFREMQLLSSGNSVTIRVEAKAGLLAYPAMYIRYEAVGEESLVAGCPWPWIRHSSLCLRVIETALTWDQAEADCQAKSGHLVSIRSQEMQDLIDLMLINSPGYHEDNSYWVGATDRRIEGDFQWTDLLPFTYTNWYDGEGDGNRQPNDDGLSGQDCVELRRKFTRPAPLVASVSESFKWNDRNCDQANFYLCQRLASGEKMRPETQAARWECNRTISLTQEDPRTTVTSPQFPRPYPDDLICLVTVIAPPAFTIFLEFEELVLEEEPSCSYDYVEIQAKNVTSRYCGDWSDRLKLLRRELAGPELKMKFLSDYSYHFGGFKARISIEQTWPECGGDRLQLYNHSCYLFVSYPEVTWHTANEICRGQKGEVASVHSAAEERFIVRKIRESREYSTSAVYWLGAKSNSTSFRWAWSDKTPLDFTGWVSASKESHGGAPVSNEGERCLGLQWMGSPTPLLPSSLYWSAQPCDMVGGYVCKKHNPGSGRYMNLNRTVSGTEGSLASPQHPEQYLNNLDYWVVVNAPEKTRIVVMVQALDLEYQTNCLYDFLEVLDPPDVTGGDPKRLCGHYEKKDLEKLHVISATNVAHIHFHTDFSITGKGFTLSWKAVDVSGCPLHTTTAKQGFLVSPNYPNFLLPRLDCSTTILAPVGKRVWLEVVDYDSADPILEVDLGGGEGRLVPFSSPTLLSDGVYVSSGERMQVTLRTGDNPVGRGYKIVYKAVGDVKDEQIVDLGLRTWGRLLHVNFPSGPPRSVDVSVKLIAPLGNTIHLQFNRPPDHNGASEAVCSEENTIEVLDWYSDNNGTLWRLCTEEIGSQLSIESWLNTLKIRTIYGSTPGPNINLTVSVKPDPIFKSKLIHKDVLQPLVESCTPSPCQNGGKCVTSSLTGKHSCQCVDHFTGMMCGLTLCDLQPCLFGECMLTKTKFKCACKAGYKGDTCEERIRPCSSNPCDSHGECIENSDATFRCQCYAWWEGPTCRNRIVDIPYKPLSERMLQEPFWLGLITVTVVLAVLGLFWCAKRHFPEKLEKLLQEENERNRPYISNRHCPSVRERTLAVSTTRDGLALAAAGGGGSGGSGNRAGPEPKTLLGRLGIRKPSLLSTPSLQPPAAHFHSRTFSLDDLITGSTSPSPRKKRNNSTPTKKSSASEKKQILQQLVSPALNAQESIPLSSNSLSVEPSTSSAETSFTAKLTPDQSLKLEKKVTFARLLDKVSSEMSSGSEVDLGGPRKVTSSSADQLVNRHHSDRDHPVVKSPNSTSSNQGSDSRSSSETHLSIAIGDYPARTGRKTASADSILAMFRNFSVVSAQGSPSATTPTATTTPTGSSTRDDLAGSDDSSMNNTPTSSSSCLVESPMFSKKNQIQVSVFDPLSAQKSQNNLLQPPSILLEVSNKCLSPIREMPTPMPSPAITPVMPRHNQPSFLAPQVNTKSNTLSPNPFKMTLDLPLRKDTLPLPPTNLVIPVLRVEEASPLNSTSPYPTLICPGSPPPIPRSHLPQLYSPPQYKPMLKDLDKPNSLDLPCPPPLITVTCSMTEGESDADSPATLNTQLGAVGGGSGMCYLSPFSICARNDRTTSESNLSSSGYSSMASPGPSRCGSNNPLCPTDTEDHIPHSILRRPSPLIRAPSEDSDPQVSHHAGPGAPSLSSHRFAIRPRSDSETLSDDPQLESNDEGFGTDQLDEKIEEGEVKSAKELELFIEECNKSKSPSPTATVKHCSSFETGLEACRTKSQVKHCSSAEAGLDCFRVMPTLVRHSGSAEDALDSKRSRVSLQLPSILVEGEPHCEKHISPVSSRSESPLSDKTGIGRFSPMFYGRMTDSDGLYDCGSSADLGSKSSRRYSSGRRKERRRSKSPTRITQTLLLEVPSTGKSGSMDQLGGSHSRSSSASGGSRGTKPSPKRRARPHPVSSSSSSSAESLSSIRDMTNALAQDKFLSGESRWSLEHQRSHMEDSADETEDVTSKMLPETDPASRGQRKISRMRAIGHQIRFLRRLEQSLKRSRDYQRQERMSSPERPLLPQTEEPALKRQEKRLSWLRQRSGAVSDSSAPREWTAVPTSHRSGHTD